MDWKQTILTVVLTLLGSAGFWGYLEARRAKKDANTRLLVGMAHDRITYLGMKYVERGSITRDEYENLNDYLYEPLRSSRWKRLREKGHGRGKKTTVT